MSVRHAVPILVTVLLCAGCDASGERDRYAPDPTIPPPAPSATPTTPEPSRGLPAGAGEGVESRAGVVVAEDGLVQVVTYGSSSNPSVVRGVTADGQTVRVDVRDVPDRPSTMDFVPTTSAFFLPAGVDPEQRVTFVLGDLGTVTLPSLAPGAEAWVPADR